MSEKILKALIQLFAIIARPQSSDSDRRSVVEAFLRRQLNKELVKEYLTIFDDFIGKEWIGHYQNSEDSLLVHTINWEYDINNNLVIETKSVPEVDFYCETYFYWDYETAQISYLSLMNKKMISKGKAIFENGKLKLTGKTFFPKGVQENKKTYEINKNGELADHFYRRSKGIWVMGHFIIYSEQ